MMLGFKKILGKNNNSPSDSTQFELEAFQAENDLLLIKLSDAVDEEKKTDGGSFVQLQESPSHVPSITQEKKFSATLNFSYQPSKPIPINGQSRALSKQQSDVKISCSAPMQQGTLKLKKQLDSQSFANSYQPQSSILDYTALDDSEDATEFYVGSPNSFEREKSRKSAFK